MKKNTLTSVTNGIKTKTQLFIQDAQNFVGDVVNGFQESSLEGKITKLLESDFQKAKRDECISLIASIIELSIKTETHQEWSGLQNEARRNQIKGNRLANEGNTAVTQAKDWNEKYLKWELGDAAKIYNALKLATKDSGGKITDCVIESLASDSLVKNFFEMIFTYIKHKLGLATTADLTKANGKRDAGPFMKRINANNAANAIKEKPRLVKNI